MKQIYIKNIAYRVDVREWQVENCINLFTEGATIPFISRYRKERTGGLDEVAVAEIKHWNDVFAEMEKRKETILETISQAGALTADLRKKIEDCVETRELEDLYLPYRPKRRTRAVVAKEAGLEPLADKMYNVSLVDPVPEARKFVGDKVASVEDALAGARDIIAERLSETASVRETLRQIFKTRRIVTKATKKATGPDAMKYKSYFDYSESLDRIAPHRLLAILRAEEEGILSLKIDADAEKCGKKLYYDFCQERRYPAQPLAEQMHMAFEDALRHDFLRKQLLVVPFVTRKEIMDVTEDKSFFRAKYGLPQDRFTVMVAAGGYGKSGMNRVVNALLTVKRPITIIAICGTNKLLYMRLKSLKDTLPSNIDLRPYEFVEKVYELNRASDILLTKGGPNAMLDSTLMGVPFGVFYCASEIEYLSNTLFTSVLYCGRFLPRSKQIVRWVNNCMDDPTILTPFIEATHKVREAGNGAVQIAQFLQEL